DERRGTRLFRPAALAPGISALSEDARPRDVAELLGLRLRAGDPGVSDERTAAVRGDPRVVDPAPGPRLRPRRHARNPFGCGGNGSPLCRCEWRLRRGTGARLYSGDGGRGCHDGRGSLRAYCGREV